MVRQFQRMMLLDPRQQVKRGLYPEDVVEAYQSAREFLIEDLRTEGPDRQRGRAARRVRAERLRGLRLRISGMTGSHEVMLWLYSAEEERFLKPESITVEDRSTSHLSKRRQSTAESLYPCCLEVPEDDWRRAELAAVRARFRCRSSLLTRRFCAFHRRCIPRERASPRPQIALRQRGHRRPWHLLLTREFGLTVGIQILNSIKDYNGRLREDFTTVRGFAGGDLGFEVGSFNFGTSFSLDFTRLGDFTAWDDESCVVRTDCGPSAYVDVQ